VNVVEQNLLVILKGPLVRHCPPPTYTDKQIRKWEAENRFLLDQLSQIEDGDAWWSDSEWEWFINRCLDFWGVP
jgi:hypothetical protein